MQVSTHFVNKTSDLSIQGLSKTHLQNAEMRRNVMFRPHFGVLHYRPTYNQPKIEVEQKLGSEKLLPIKTISNFHFQLQNCLHSLSQHDIVTTTENHLTHVNLLTGKQLDFKGSEGQYMCIGSNKQLTAAARSLGDLLVFSNETNEPVWQPIDTSKGQRNLQIGSIMFDDSKLWLGGNKKQIIKFDIETQKLHSYTDVNKELNCFTSQNGLTVAACDSTKLPLIDEKSQKIIGYLDEHLDFNMAVDLKLEHFLIASGSQDLSTRLWDIRKYDKSLKLIPCIRAAANRVKLFGNGRVAIGEAIDYLHVYDLPLDTIDTRQMFGTLVGLAISEFDKKLFWGISDRHMPCGICVFDIIPRGSSFDF